LNGLAEAAAEANALAEAGEEQALAELRTRWADEVEAGVRHGDYRMRALAYRAIGDFRFRQKTELLRRGLEDESPAARGAALLSLERLSRDGPGPVNTVRPLLHELATRDANASVRRLAIACLRNASPERYTILLLNGIADDEEQPRELRDASRKVAGELTKRSRAR